MQAEVKQPEIYLLAMGSSAIKDQASVIADRLGCLQDLSTPTLASNGVEILDTPLCSFVAMTQQPNLKEAPNKGGHYKCGGRRGRDSMMGDQAHALRCTWHSLTVVQSLATAGSLEDTWFTQAL